MSKTYEFTEGVLGFTGMMLMVVLWCLVVLT
jgi:hypothetical protein